MSIHVHVDKENDQFVLQGDLNLIRSRKRVRSNFKAIGSDINSNPNCIYISFFIEGDTNFSNSSYREEKYKKIKEIFNKFNIPFQITPATQEFVADVEREIERFYDFSNAAKKIRNNEDIKDDLESFSMNISKNLARELFPLQLLSAYHLAFAQNACNFSVPGSGKTSVVYAAYAYLKSLPDTDPKHVNRLFIISPLSAFQPWEHEYFACFDKQPSICILSGESAERRRQKLYSSEYNEITITSYQSASGESDISAIQDFLKREENKVMLVLDEAHRIKNVAGGLWATSILSIAKHANSRVVLTGTPIPNGYQDLYNLYQFIWPNQKIIQFPVPYLEALSDRILVGSTERDTQNLIDQISPFFIRIKKTDLGLPNPVENPPIMIEMTERQREIYDYIEKNYVDYVERSQQDSLWQHFKTARMIRLMQAATNVNLLRRPLEDFYSTYTGVSRSLYDNDKRIADLINSQTHQDIPSKFTAILEIVRRVSKATGPSGKIVIWSAFLQNLFELQEYMQQNHFEAKLLYGAVPNKDRERVIEGFHHENCTYKIIIANPAVIGESISLHKACHNAIYLDKTFNAATYMQSKDRIHRYGLKKDDKINYYHLLSRDSVDETIYNRVLAKEGRMLQIIESQEIPLFSTMQDDVEQEDIQAIIRDYHARQSAI